MNNEIPKTILAGRKNPPEKRGRRKNVLKWIQNRYKDYKQLQF